MANDNMNSNNPSQTSSATPSQTSTNRPIQPDPNLDDTNKMNPTPLSGTDPTKGRQIPPPPQPSNSSRTYKGKAIATILGLVLLVTGMAVGVLLVNQNQEVRVGAFECSSYVFDIRPDGSVVVRNGTTRDQGAQNATISINELEVKTFSVPELASGSAVTLGVIEVPEGSFDWEVVGSVDCESSGKY